MKEIGPTEFRIIKVICWCVLVSVVVSLYTFFGLFFLGEAEVWSLSTAPLYTLAKAGDAAAVASLLEKGASPDSLGTLRWVPPAVGRHLKRQTPLFAAAERGTFPVWVPCAAAERDDWTGHTATVELLIKAGAALHTGTTLGPFGSIAKESALRSAAGNGHSDVVQLLLDAGAAPDAGTAVGPLGVVRTDTPLQWASKKGHTAIVQLLLEAGADVDAGVTVGPLGVLRRDTPLKWALSQGHTAIVQLLLEAGAMSQQRAPEDL